MPWQPPQGQNLPGTHFSAVLGFSRRQPLDRYHTRFGSLEDGANLEDFTGGYAWECRHS